VFALKIPDVGDGLAAQLVSEAHPYGGQRVTAHLDCGSQQNPQRAFDHLRRGQPRQLFLSHFHLDHYNGLATAYAGGRYARSTKIQALYYPQLPHMDSVDRLELTRQFLALNAFLMGTQTGSAEADLINILEHLNTDQFSYEALSSGDEILVGESRATVLWPPKKVDSKTTLTVITKAIAAFQAAVEDDSELKHIYSEMTAIAASRLLHAEKATSELEKPYKPLRFERTGKLSSKVTKALKAQRDAANHLSLAIRFDDILLFMGDLNSNQIQPVVQKLVNSGYSNFDYLLTPHHGTHWHDQLLQMQFHRAISSIGPVLIAHIVPEYGRISHTHWATHIQGEWFSRHDNVWP
jgi:hypothetical protein